MKKHILNRPMFRQVKSPAYGTGIATNLVSDEERQRYNYGGRVRAQGGVYTGGPVRIGSESQIPTWWDYSSMGPVVTMDGGQWYKRTGDKEDESTDYIEIPSYEAREYPKITSLDLEYLQQKNAADVAARADANSPIRKQTDRKFEEGTDWRKNIAIPGAEVTVDESADEIIDMPDPHLRRKTKFDDNITEFKKGNTDTIDIADPFAILDKSIAERKRLGKANALMKAAAAAVKWGGAPTAEKRSAAIAEGLTAFGDEASKAELAGIDLKDRANILKAVEETKQKGKKEIKEMDIKANKWKEEHYKGSLDLQERIAFNRNKGKSSLEIYDDFLMTGEGKNPLMKRDVLYALTGKKIPLAITEDEEKIYKMPENEGQVFIDKNNQLVKYKGGKKITVDEKTDESFSWN